MSTRPRQLRRNATDAENRLWYVLRNRSLGGRKFVRQFPIGPYIADFACREAALIVELDGGQHAENAEDISRTTYLNSEGYSVVRFWNDEVMDNRDGVLLAIMSVIEGTPSPNLRYAPATLSPMGRGIRGVRATASSHRQALGKLPLPPRGRGTTGARAADGANFLNEARSVLLPLGEKVVRPQGETDEGVLRL